MLLLFLGLFIALFLYPLLHETGHIAAIYLFGGTIEDTTWIPRYSVLCNTTALTTGEQAVIGLSGGIFPVVVSLLPVTLGYPFWYISFILKGINLYYSILNTLYILLFLFGHAVPKTDITLTLSVKPSLAPLLLLFFPSIFLLLFLVTKKAAPISTTLAFFFQPDA